MGEGEGDRQGAVAGEYTNFQHCFRVSQFDPQTHELALFGTKMHAAWGGVRFPPARRKLHEATSLEDSRKRVRLVVRFCKTGSGSLRRVVKLN
jgi:hypothetical protein